jgi:hypothetical protein
VRWWLSHLVWNVFPSVITEMDFEELSLLGVRLTGFPITLMENSLPRRVVIDYGQISQTKLGYSHNMQRV